MVRAGAALLVLLVSQMGSSARGADAASWPQFKHDALRSGDNPLAKLAFPLARTAAVRFPAPIYASPAVADGRVYVQDAWGNVACVDPAKNAVVWTVSLGGINNSSSPAVADGKVYVGNTADAFYILDAATGKTLAKIPAEGGVITAPGVVPGGVYFSAINGRLTKIDMMGKTLWSFDGGRLSTVEFAVKGDTILFFAGTDNTIFYRLKDEGSQVKILKKDPAPQQCCPTGGPAFVGSASFVFQSYDSEFGRFFLDGKQFINDVNDARGTPSVRGDLVYRGDKCLSVAGNKLSVEWRADPSVLYDGGYHSSPALGDNVLAIGSELGSLWFFDLDGTDKVRKPRWEFKTTRAGKPNGAISSSPALVDGAVYFGGEDGILYGLSKGTEAPIVDLQPASPRRLVRHKLTGAEWPTVGGDIGYSYVSTDREVKPPFRVEWKTRLWSTMKAPMIVADSMVFFGGRQGSLIALDAATGEILWKFHHPGVESRPGPIWADGKLLIMRSRANQGDSPHVNGASDGPNGEGLWCHDARTGEVLWRKPMRIKYHFNHDGLNAFQGTVFMQEMDPAGVIQGAAYRIDDGKEIWRTKLNLGAASSIKGGLKLPPRFAGAVADDLWCVSVSDRGTAAFHPQTGEIVWSKNGVSISNRTRIAARNSTLVVFSEKKGCIALDPRTGKELWVANTPAKYSNALTDVYLESKGQKAIHPNGACSWPVFANGYWYSHSSFSGSDWSRNNIIAMRLPTDEENTGVFTAKQIAWSYDFLSNACPSPTPSYGRLFYSPAGEGVVYSFRPVSADVPNNRPTKP